MQRQAASSAARLGICLSMSGFQHTPGLCRHRRVERLPIAKEFRGKTIDEAEIVADMDVPLSGRQRFFGTRPAQAAGYERVLALALGDHQHLVQIA